MPISTPSRSCEFIIFLLSTFPDPSSHRTLGRTSTFRSLAIFHRLRSPYISERIKTVRKEARLTQSEFGKVIGVSRDAVYNAENARANLTDLLVLSICREFNINEQWLRTGEGDMYVKRTKNQEIAAFIGEFSNDKDGSFKRDLVHVLSQLSEEQWGLLADMAEKLYQEYKKRADQ